LKIFAKKDNRLIGLYDVTRSGGGGLFGFGERMILENFYKSEKYDNRSMALNIYLRLFVFIRDDRPVRVPTGCIPNLILLSNSIHIYLIEKLYLLKHNNITEGIRRTLYVEHGETPIRFFNGRSSYFKMKCLFGRFPKTAIICR